MLQHVTLGLQRLQGHRALSLQLCKPGDGLKQGWKGHGGGKYDQELSRDCRHLPGWAVGLLELQGLRKR